ncbi:MAG: CrcB family protein [Actinomycetaceae bacterium]|nr:CrcB family protein [Actinomycetaceae bacterium]
MENKVPPRHFIFVAIGGFFGAIARASLDVIGHGTTAMEILPFSTAFANTLGALLLGFLTGFVAVSTPRWPLLEELRIMGGTGFLGAFTTYSSFALAFAGAPRWSLVAVEATLYLTLGIVAATIGIFSGKALARAVHKQ